MSSEARQIDDAGRSVLGAAAEDPAGDPGADIDRRRYRIAFGAIVGAAAVLRVVYVIAAKRGEALAGDQIYYSAQAVTIANGRWFADPFLEGRFAADHAPLTSLVLAPVSWSDRNPVFTQRLLMAVLGVAVVIGIGVLARWLFGRGVSLTATAIAAVYANLWMNDALLMSETLSAGAVVAILLAVYLYDARAGVATAALMGLTLGLGGLARAELLLLGPLVVLPLTLIGRRAPSWSTRLVHLGAATAVTLALLAPWVVRNQVRFEDTTVISTQDGLTLLGANCADTYFGPGKGFWSLQCSERVDVPVDADQSERSSLFREEAIDFISDNVGEVPSVVVARLGRGLSVWETEGMIYLNAGEGREAWASRIGLWQFWVLTPLAVWGWWRWPSRQARWPAMTVAALSVLVIAAFYGIPRFRIPAEVVIVLGAAVAVHAGIRALGRQLGTGSSSEARQVTLPDEPAATSG
jgi:4-amino-4-deoxy-L-arabinose transferase-like glycosyltransferase